MFFGELPVREALGTILAHSRKLDGRTLKKGHVLDQDDLKALTDTGLDVITVARLDGDDVGENEAADQIASALMGAGLTGKRPFTGRSNLFAHHDGLLQIDRTTLDQINLVDESITIATLAPDTVVRAGQMVATIKIIPFAVPEAMVSQCVDHAKSAQQLVLRVAPLRPQTAVLVQTEMPETPKRMLDKTRLVVEQRLAALGVTLTAEHRCQHAVSTLVEQISTLQTGGSDMILIAGASAIVDRRDIIPESLRRCGGVVEHFGMPVDPGNLLMIGSLDGVKVVGLPGCARSPKFNGLDMVLSRLAADVNVDSDYVMRLGSAGLLKEFASRPQPRLQQTVSDKSRGTPKIAAIVLAAGQSRRMGSDNKLLLELSGKSMLQSAVEAAKDSKASEVVVVTGHESAMVRQSCDAEGVCFVHNEDFANGLSTSLRVGLSAVDDEIDGVIFCLGDMPMIQAAHINALIDAFDPVEGRKICVPTVNGKRGNPVLWSADFFDEICAVSGDTGARHLIGENDEAVVEVAFDDAGPVTDIDTPEMYAQISSE